MEDITYKLKILYPSSNKWKDIQFYEKTIIARGVEHENGSMLFYDGEGDLIAVYPSHYTIIESVE